MRLFYEYALLDSVAFGEYLTDVSRHNIFEEPGQDVPFFSEGTKIIRPPDVCASLRRNFMVSGAPSLHLTKASKFLQSA